MTRDCWRWDFFWENAGKKILLELQVIFCHLSTGTSRDELHLELLPAGDQEEEGQDDEEREPADCRRDDDEHLPLVGRQVWRCRWGQGRGTDSGVAGREERVKQKEGEMKCKEQASVIKAERVGGDIKGNRWWEGIKRE